MLNGVTHDGPTAQDGPKRSIVLYSPDRDFCMSLSMLWKDEFDIVTTTDDEMIFTLVQSIQPDVFLAESVPTARLQRKFELLKAKLPGLRIVMLCVPPRAKSELPENLKRFVDAVYMEPVDLRSFEKCVHSMEWMT